MSEKRGERFFGFLATFARAFREFNISVEAASLTFVTFMGFVPFFMFTIFVLPYLLFLNPEQKVETMLFSVFLPESARQVQHYLQDIIYQRLSFGIVNTVLLMILSFVLFRSVNNSFDRILRVASEKRRNWWWKFVRFIAMTVFGIIVIFILFSASSVPLMSNLLGIPGLNAMMNIVLPFFLFFTIVILVFLFIPTIRVKSRSLFVGTSVTTLLWAVMKSSYNWYVMNVTQMERVFGIFASLPIFMFWIYANWIIILSGIVIVSILEGRFGRTTKLDETRGKIRIVFEKSVDNDTITVTKKFTQKELRDVLRNMLMEEDDGKDR